MRAYAQRLCRENSAHSMEVTKEMLARLPELPLEEGLRAVATGLAAHKSIDEGRVVAMNEVLPAGW